MIAGDCYKEDVHLDWCAGLVSIIALEWPNMSNTLYPVLNPNTSLAFLLPSSATQLEVYRYLAVATLGAYTSNIISQMQKHYKLLCKFRVTYSTIAYILSIFSTWSYIIGCVIFHVGRVPSCHIFTKIVAIGYAVAIPATSMLFLLRVYALFHGERCVLLLFSLLWLGVLGCAMTLPFSLSGTHNGPTQNCIDSGVLGYSSAGIVAATVFDSLVFFVVSWRLLGEFMAGSTPRDRVKTFVSGGRMLPALSSCLLQSGQLYYLVTVLSNIATTVLILSPNVPPILHAALTTPNSALTNAMGCKVFLDVKLGDHSARSLSAVGRQPQTHLFSTTPAELPMFMQEKSTSVNSDLIQSDVRIMIGPAQRCSSGINPTSQLSTLPEE